MKNYVPIGCDHAGYELKTAVIDYLKSKNYQIEDVGTYSEESTDYPEYGHKVADLVNQNEDTLGIVICGSGNGINMTTNKHQGIRSALCWKVEIAELARLHNNANILALPARFISKEDALKIIDAFLSTKFEGGRHERRVNKIPC